MKMTVADILQSSGLVRIEALSRLKIVFQFTASLEEVDLAQQRFIRSPETESHQWSCRSTLLQCLWLILSALTVPLLLQSSGVLMC